MKDSLIFLFLIISIHAKLQKINTCTYTSSVTEDPRYDDCKAVSTGDDEQCCVGVESFYGQNRYFCETFNKSATQDEINSKLEELKDYYYKNFPGLEVKLAASCTGDIPPFKAEKCSVEDTQRIEPFGNCTDFKKNKDDDYCCLFSGKVKNDEVLFCTELNEGEVSNIDETTKKIDRKSNMYDIKYISCSPSYNPDSKQFYLSYNLLILGLVLLISF